MGTAAWTVGVFYPEDHEGFDNSHLNISNIPRYCYGSSDIGNISESDHSPAKPWEIAMLINLGRLSPRGTSEAWLSELIETSGVIVKEITPSIAVLSTQFPSDFPGDPADRLIGATARAEGLILVTRDSGLRGSTLIKAVW